MPRTKLTHPAYCHHKRSGIGYVTIDGRQRNLPGKYGSAESRAAYDALIGQWLGNGRQMPQEPAEAATGITVSVVALAFWKHAQAHYRHPDGMLTGEAANYRPALRALRKLYGATAAADFGPKKLRALRTSMIQPHEEPDPKTGTTFHHPGWSRTYANRQVWRVILVFRWAASEEMVDAKLVAQLETLDPIPPGKDGARETTPVDDVPDEVVNATLPFMPPPVAALVKLQRLNCARGGELFKLRACDIDMSEPVWKYRPAKHKTAHKNKRRVIRFGPQAQQILEPFLSTDVQAYLFRPADAIAWRLERLRANRKTPLRNKPRRERKVRAHYNKDTYARAIARACDRADAWARGGRVISNDERLVPRWHPHQLRHTASGKYRAAGNEEVSQIMLGHSTPRMTEHYAKRDDQKADAVVTLIG